MGLREISLADNPRTAIKGQIKRATARAQASMNRLDREKLARLDAIYRNAADQLQAAIHSYAPGSGNLRLEVMRDLVEDVQGRLDQLARVRDDLFPQSLLEAATLGVQPFQLPGVGVNISRVPAEAVSFVSSFVDDNGLQLSDRLWRIDRSARQAVTQAIESAIVQGHSASQAVGDFLRRGQAVPSEIDTKMKSSNAIKVGQSARDALINDDGNARVNALRVMRTEMNRAHGVAYRQAGFQHPDVIGTRFLLSPRHPQVDICDMHARVNLYGLGRGVYPEGKSPWPAHPNTLSYEEVVFSDEVTDADRAGKETRIEWLNGQAAGTQISVLGSTMKRNALSQGILKENQIATPWRVLKPYYERKGVDIDALRPSPAIDAVTITEGPHSQPPRSVLKVSDALEPVAQVKVVRYVTEVIDSVHSDGRLPKIEVRNASSNAKFYGQYSSPAGGGPSAKIRMKAGSAHKELTLAHEIGHFLDHQGAPGMGFSSERHQVFEEWREIVSETKAIKSLIKALEESPGRGYIRYLLEYCEVWARSYSQWVALRANDPVIQGQIREIIKREQASPLPLTSQWDDDDFEPVAAAIDRLMKKLGWV